jgi:hypothetical protein
MENPPKYLRTVPKVVPEGLVIVHSHIRPRAILGDHGFRAWLQRPNENVEICDCGWAPQLSVHYCAAWTKKKD